MAGTVVGANRAPTNRANDGRLTVRAAAFGGRFDDFDVIRTPHLAQVVLVQDVTRGRVLTRNRQKYHSGLPTESRT